MSKKSSTEKSDIFKIDLEESQKGKSVSLGLVPDGPIVIENHALDPEAVWKVNSNQSNEKTEFLIPIKNDDKTELLIEGKNDDKTQLLPQAHAAHESDDKTKVLGDGSFTLPPLPMAESVSIQGIPHLSDNEKTVAVQDLINPKNSLHTQISDPTLSHKSYDKKEAKRIVRTEVAVKVNSAEAALIQSENLRLAQEKIEVLEKQVESLRAENDELASSAEIFKNSSDHLHRQLQSYEKIKRENEEVYANEIHFLKEALRQKELDSYKLKEKNEELEQRINNDLRKVRVRERELENRLELLKAEKSSVVKAKDDMILDLKRKLDVVESELEMFRRKTLDLSDRYDGSQDQMRRTVRALRIALNHLESSEEDQPLKKAE